MPRPLTRSQALQNAAFLDMLRRTGNARLAARELGVHRSTFTKRRASHAAFATAWDAALVIAHAAFHRAGGSRLPEAAPVRRAAPSLRTQGGEPAVTRLKNGRLQLRLAPPGRITGAGEQAFLAALSASANIRLSAAATGFAHSSFYSRRRQSPAFAREMRLALRKGYERLECGLHEAGLAGSHEHDGWRHNDPPPTPPTTVNQALQLLHLHANQVKHGWEQPHRRKRRGESEEAYVERLRAMWACEKRREAEDAALRRAARYDLTRGWRMEDEPEPPPLPPLHLVTGWSKASGKPPHHPELALFGGWRIKDIPRSGTSGEGRG